MVRTLAREQFDDYVKRVRIFVHPRLVAKLQGGCRIWRSGLARRSARLSG